MDRPARKIVLTIRRQRVKRIMVLLVIDVQKGITDERLYGYQQFEDNLKQLIDASLTPWVGFAYTFPKYRGKRCMGKLLEYAYDLAEKEGHKYIYISTGEVGLYEKYGYTFWKMMTDVYGDESRVYRREIHHV